MQGKYSWPGILVDLHVLCYVSANASALFRACVLLQARVHIWYITVCVYVCNWNGVLYIWYKWDYCMCVYVSVSVFAWVGGS